MLLLIFFLIFFFLLLIIYQWVELFSKKTILEGVENNSNDPNDPTSSSSLEQKVNDLSGNVTDLQGQVNSIMQAQQQYTNQMGPTEPTITGQFD
jgi:hypothetical protein